MVDLLAPVTSRRPTDEGGPPGRPLALGAAVAGVAAPAVAVLLLWVVGLVGWFAADGGSHGTTRSVLRVAVDGWLLAHGAHLTLDHGTVVTASPLGLTVACLALAYRWGRWAGATCEVGDLRTAGGGAVVLAGVYALVSLVAAVAAAAPGAEPGLRTALVGGALVGAAGGGAGILRGAGLAGVARRAVPPAGRSVAYGALLTVGGTVAAGALLALVAVSVRGAAAANIAEQLRLDATGAALSLLLLVALVPNVALLAATYLLGPGFAVGTGTLVAPDQVALGPLPALPVLGALPPEGWAPAPLAALLAVPVVCAMAGVAVAGVVVPARSMLAGAGRGLGAGLAACILLALLVWQAGGAVGPGRMQDVGADVTEAFAACLLLYVPAGAVAGAAAAWWTGRRAAG